MKLIYRGTSYEYDPCAQRSVERSRTVRLPYNVIYRGLAYTIDPNAAPSDLPRKPIANLVYRGVTYALNGGAIAAANNLVLGPKASAKDVAKVHRSNVYRNVQRRLQAAQARGDQHLVALLEQELQQIA